MITLSALGIQQVQEPGDHERCDGPAVERQAGVAQSPDRGGQSIAVRDASIHQNHLTSGWIRL
jgi:hypothetical protein